MTAAALAVTDDEAPQEVELEAVLYTTLTDESLEDGDHTGTGYQLPDGDRFQPEDLGGAIQPNWFFDSVPEFARFLIDTVDLGGVELASVGPDGHPMLMFHGQRQVHDDGHDQYLQLDAMMRMEADVTDTVLAQLGDEIPGLKRVFERVRQEIRSQAS